MSLTTPNDIEAVLKPLLLSWLATYEVQGVAAREPIPAISLGQPSDGTRVITTGIECIVSKTPARRPEELHAGGGKIRHKEHRIMLMLWQPWQPELSGQGLTPKISGFDSDTGDGLSVLDKIYDLSDRNWIVREISSKQDTGINPASYVLGIKTEPSYCE